MHQKWITVAFVERCSMLKPSVHKGIWWYCKTHHRISKGTVQSIGKIFFDHIHQLFLFQILLQESFLSDRRNHLWFQTAAERLTISVVHRFLEWPNCAFTHLGFHSAVVWSSYHHLYFPFLFLLVVFQFVWLFKDIFLNIYITFNFSRPLFDSSPHVQ